MTQTVSFNSESRLRKAAGHTAIEVDGQVMLMSESQGRYFGLDDIGSDIWRRLEKPQTMKELNASLASSYEAAPGVIEHDLAALLTSLQSHDLLEVEDGAKG